MRPTDFVAIPDSPPTRPKQESEAPEMTLEGRDDAEPFCVPSPVCAVPPPITPSVPDHPQGVVEVRALPPTPESAAVSFGGLCTDALLTLWHMDCMYFNVQWLDDDTYLRRKAEETGLPLGGLGPYLQELSRTVGELKPGEGVACGGLNGLPFFLYTTRTERGAVDAFVDVDVTLATHRNAEFARSVVGKQLLLSGLPSSLEAVNVVLDAVWAMDDGPSQDRVKEAVVSLSSYSGVKKVLLVCF